jgi:hypothetical protein
MPWWKPEVFLTWTHSETCRRMCSPTKPTGVSVVSVVSTTETWRTTLMGDYVIICLDVLTRSRQSRWRETYGSGVSIVTENRLHGNRHQSGIVSDGDPWSSISEFPGLPLWVIGAFWSIPLEPILDMGYHSKPTWLETLVSMKTFERYIQNTSYLAEETTWCLMSNLASVYHVHIITKTRSEYTRDGVLSAPNQ